MELLNGMLILGGTALTGVVSPVYFRMVSSHGSLDHCLVCPTILFQTVTPTQYF